MHQSSTICAPMLTAAALLAGCAGLPGGPPIGTQPGYGPTPTPAAACRPIVTINVTRVDLTGPMPSIEVSDGRARIPKGDAMVRWRLPNSLEFLADGITFKPGSPAGPTTAPATGDPQRFEWCFLSTVDAIWDYKLRFKTTATPSTAWECDPTIINSEAFVPIVAATSNCNLLP